MRSWLDYCARRMAMSGSTGNEQSQHNADATSLGRLLLTATVQTRRCDLIARFCVLQPLQERVGR